ncbi:hypothetical protein KAR91_43730 [Candidatus Pacearchaeota archaeon]|nr:hypothetical protein [Candidatus Pacearchaeota archaeon]
MTNAETQIELNKIIEDINSILIGKQCETTGRHEFAPLLVGFRPCVSQLTVFASDIILEDSVCVDKCEPHSRDLIIERTISACDRMIDTLKTHIYKLEGMLTPTPR